MSFGIKANLERKENGIIFDAVSIPNYAAAVNIAHWNSKCTNYVRYFTNGGIIIEAVK